MTMSTPLLVGADPETPISVLRRFSITTLEQSLEAFTVLAAMPVSGMTNPVTGQPSIAGLAILVDDAAGRVNYYRQGGPTVSSELTVDLSPGAIESLGRWPDEPVLAAAGPLGPAGSPLLSVCTLTHRGTEIGTGTVHTVGLPGDGPPEPQNRGSDPLADRPGIDIGELMAVEPLTVRDGFVRLCQRPDPMVNNMIGIVHGGVSSAGLELAAAAAINHTQDHPFQTASIRVNFLRPFLAGADAGAESHDAQSHYEGSVLRIGRTSAVADAQAIGPDGKVAVIARVTAYR